MSLSLVNIVAIIVNPKNNHIRYIAIYRPSVKYCGAGINSPNPIVVSETIAKYTAILYDHWFSIIVNIKAGISTIPPNPITAKITNEYVSLCLLAKNLLQEIRASNLSQTPDKYLPIVISHTTSNGIPIKANIQRNARPPSVLGEE